ncbi:hypothetical protein D3C71_1772160 [compost metagenome]
MRLDGGFRNIQRIGDLLVQQAFRQHAQNPALLRRQRSEPADEISHVRIMLLFALTACRYPHIAFKNRANAIPDIVDARGFGNKTGSAEFDGPANSGRVVRCRNDDDGQAGKFRPQRHQA